MFDFLLGNDFLAAIIAFGIVLIPAVIIHELGHFLAAKAVGITILEFGVGFPPRVAKLFTWGETEFTLNIVPLGGFVRPLGEDMIRPLGEEETERDRQKLVATYEEQKPQDGEYLTEREELAARGVYDVKSVNEAKPLPRIFFMAAGALANFISAFLIFIVIALIGIPEVVGGRIGLLGVDPAITEIGLQSEDFIEGIDGEFFIDSADFFEQLQALEGETITLTVRRPGVEDPFVTEPFTLTESISQTLISRNEGVLVIGVAGDSPAEGQLFAGDLIVGVNGDSLLAYDDAIQLLQDYSVNLAGETITLEVIRDSEQINVELIPRVNPPPNTGRIGISIGPGFTNEAQNLVIIDAQPVETIVSQSIGDSINYGIDRIVEVFRLIVEFPSRLLQGSTQPEERRIVSIVGVSQLGGVVLQDSIEEDQPVVILEYVALISIALGFTNLLPIPALDGGRILFVLIEIVRGKPISPEREGLVHLAGLIFLLFIGVIFIFNDIMNPITDMIP